MYESQSYRCSIEQTIKGVQCVGQSDLSFWRGACRQVAVLMAMTGLPATSAPPQRIIARAHGCRNGSIPAALMAAPYAAKSF